MSTGLGECQVNTLKGYGLEPPLDIPTAQAMTHDGEHFLPDWFGAAQIPILLACCQHVCRSGQIELTLAGMDPVQNFEQFEMLTIFGGGASRPKMRRTHTPCG